MVGPFRRAGFGSKRYFQSSPNPKAIEHQYPPVSHERPGERIREVGAKVNALVLRAITAFVVLVMFIGLAYLVYIGEVESGALLLYVGVILGYIIHATKEAV